MERIDAQEFEIQSLSDIVPEEPEPQKMVIENVPVEVIPIRRFVRRF
jgi:hypothetical protein